MQQRDLISKLIDLEEQARIHSSEYLKLVRMPGKLTKAFYHNRREQELRFRIKDLMKHIAFVREEVPQDSELSE